MEHWWGNLSSSFVSSLRNGDVFLLGGSTYRVASIRGSRVNVTSATGYRPTIPSWTGETASRTHELSQEVLELLKYLQFNLDLGLDNKVFFKEALGLNRAVAQCCSQIFR